MYSNFVGGKWWKIDFHMHTPASDDYGHGDDVEQNISPREYLEVCMEKELDCVIITDHNSFGWIEKLREAYEELENERNDNFRELIIFPGIELNTQGNVHLLGIFDPGCSIESLLKILGLLRYNESTETTDISPNEVMEKIIEKKGIAIPAHVDQPSGLFYENVVPSIKKAAMQVSEVLAFEVIGESIDDAIFITSKKKVAYVSGSDAHVKDDIARRYTWVKMGEPNIEALRLALFDNQDSVLRSDYMQINNPNDLHGRIFLKSLKIDSGYRIGLGEPYHLEFSPWLNSIIGGRGTGKSTIINFLRLVLGRKDELPQNVKEDFDNFICVPQNRKALGMLRNDTVVELNIVVDGIEHQLKWENNNLKEYDFEREIYVEAESVNERFPVSIFSQKQLYEMTKNPQLLFDYLDAEWDFLEWNQKVIKLKQQYSFLSAQKRNLQNELREKKKFETLLRDVKAKLSVFENTEIKDIFSKKQNLAQKKKNVQKIYTYYSDIIRIYNDWKALNILDGDEKTELDEVNIIEINEWIDSLKNLKMKIDSIFDEFSDKLISFDELFKRLSLSSEIERNDAEVIRALELLEEAGVSDVDKYADLISEKEKIENELLKYDDVEKRIHELNSELNSKKTEIHNLILERYNKRNEIINSWNDLGMIRLSLVLFGDMENNEQQFRSIIRKDNGYDQDILFENQETGIMDKGIIADIFKLGKENNIEKSLECLEDLKLAMIEGRLESGKRFKEYLKTLINEHPDCEDELYTWIPDDSIDMEIKINNEFRTVDSGSPGQRTSAILSLIFGISRTPIIIDQPEDDLDTRNITNIIVDGICQVKKNQQVIVVTHNPNIVVNTNSEQVIQMDFVNGLIRNRCTGALQNHDIRDAICEVMEGGKEALEKRYYRIFKALER